MERPKLDGSWRYIGTYYLGIEWLTQSLPGKPFFGCGKPGAKKAKGRLPVPAATPFLV